MVVAAGEEGGPTRCSTRSGRELGRLWWCRRTRKLGEEGVVGVASGMRAEEDDDLLSSGACHGERRRVQGGQPSRH